MRLDRKGHHGAWSSVPDNELLAVYPDGDHMPHYSRDAELFIGTLDDIQSWIAGVQWVAAYNAMIGLDNGTKRKRLEESERERQLLEALRTGEQPRLRR